VVKSASQERLLSPSNSARNASYGEATGAPFQSVTRICATNQERQRNRQEC
jgi:hypothetical protein